ncbi:SPOR domain-containing protein [Rhodoferax sp.]|uniref:SPOR domain-containing protein n=1 Tax=Rhodoferax sp. TaxID=50421 RepID=UPI001EC11EBE|nr:SPOR domain-containing protein [Rhodoferax sp.]MBT9507453.1 SPOR domain-containing protein [Rhodoferax sp.]
MVRFIVLALVLMNGLYFAWSQGFLLAYDFGPVPQAEPQRLRQQIKPEALHVLTAQELRQAEAASRVVAKPPECLQAGLLDATQSAAVRTVLEAALPVGSWLLDAVVEPARWIVYMGKYPNADALAKKRAELANLNLRFEPLINPTLEWGLSLGGFDTQAAANAALEALNRRGVRTARVVQERAELRGMLLRVPAADEALKAQLEELKPLLSGKAFAPCR